jgi:transcriptional regulator with GAF, ATPase, and Fis domain
VSDDREAYGFGDIVTDVVAGAAEPSAPAVGAVVRIAQGEPRELALSRPCRIGSDPACDIVVQDRTISRLHVELSPVAGGVHVRDLGSRNGTFYLGQRVGELTVAIGARLQISGLTLSLDPDTEMLLRDLSYAGTEYRGVLGASVKMRKLFAILQRLERSLATVLIEGESGVGKEMVARAIHEGSERASGRLVTVNCGAIPRDLVASELFGHRRGAFTGASEARRGAFDVADGGTLFLDEIGELSPEVQPALLRAIELGEIRPVGDDEPRQVRVRLIAATNRDLLDEVAEKRFREDLYFRLAVVRVQVPPLRGRPEDVELLAAHFARASGLPALAPTIIEELKGRRWAGNARELRNAIAAYAAIGELPPPTSARGASLDDALDARIDATLPYAEQKDAFVDDFTRRYLRALLALTNGNQSAAAKVAGIDRTHLGRLLAKFGMNARRG